MLTLKAVDKRFVRSDKRRVKIVGISSLNESVYINAHKFTGNELMSESLDMVDIIKCIEIQSKASKLTCTFK